MVSGASTACTEPEVGIDPGLQSLVVTSGSPRKTTLVALGSPEQLALSVVSGVTVTLVASASTVTGCTVSREMFDWRCCFQASNRALSLFLCDGVFFFNFFCWTFPGSVFILVGPPWMTSQGTEFNLHKFSTGKFTVNLARWPFFPIFHDAPGTWTSSAARNVHAAAGIPGIFNIVWEQYEISISRTPSQG